MSSPNYTAWASGGNSNQSLSAFLQVNTQRGRITPSLSSRSSVHSTSTTESLSSMSSLGVKDSKNSGAGEGDNGRNGKRSRFSKWFSRSGSSAASSSTSASAPAPAATSHPENPPPAYEDSFHDAAPSLFPAPAGLASSSAGGFNMLRSATQMLVDDSDEFAFLAEFDTVLVVDDSLSMTTHGRWQEAREAIRRIAEVCAEYDDDGIDIYFLNHISKYPPKGYKQGGGYVGVNSSRRVENIFDSVVPHDCTPTGETLRRILEPYLDAYEAAKAGQGSRIRRLNVIVITDGEATDDLEGEVKHFAKTLDNLRAPPSQVGIQFFQVGKSPRATRALNRLDDLLEKDGVRDMVDTVTWDDNNKQTLSAETILKTVLGGVTRRLDAQPRNLDAQPHRRSQR